MVSIPLPYHPSGERVYYTDLLQFERDMVSLNKRPELPCDKS